MFNTAMKTTLLVIAVAALSLPTSSAPHYANTHAYGVLQKDWSHHPVMHSLGHGPLSHWALALNGHLKHGLHKIKHATLGLKHELKHGGLLGLKHSILTKHGGFMKHAHFGHGSFTKHADIGHGHVALGAYGGVGHQPLVQHHDYGHHALVGQEGTPLVGPVFVADGHAPLVDYTGYANGGSDVRAAIPLSEYQNFPTDG